MEQKATCFFLKMPLLKIFDREKMDLDDDALVNHNFNSGGSLENTSKVPLRQTKKLVFTRVWI